MSDLIQVADDGTITVGLDKHWKPVPIEQAVLVKRIEPSGRVQFLQPSKEPA